MNGRRCIAAGCLVAGLALATAALARDADEHSYWLGFAENYGDDIRLSLLIDAAAPTAGTVEIPGLGFSTRFTTTAAATTSIELPIEAMARPGKPAALGIRIRADGEIVVRGLNHRQSSSDAFLALPLATLGREYRGLGYTQLRADQPSQLLVVATHDDTQLKIEARDDCPAADLRLNRGQVWLYGCADVSGLNLQATQPVAVFGGARCAEVPIGQAFCGHLVEQLPPVPAWDQRFAVLPLATRKGSDQVRIVSHEDGNEVRIDGELVTTLAAGQVHQFTPTKPLLIETGKPALVAQYAASGQADGGVGDPFMALVPAVTQFAARQIVSAPSPSADAKPESGPAFASHHLNIVLPAAAVTSLRVDGQAVDAKLFVPIGDGSLRGAVLPLTPGRHPLAADAPFGAIVYGFGDTDAYGLPGALILAPPPPEAAEARAGDNPPAPPTPQVPR